MNVKGRSVRRSRQFASSQSTAAAPTSGIAASAICHARTLAVGSSRMASGGSLRIATPKMRRPISSGVSVRHAIDGVTDRGELTAGAFPQDFAAPAQRAADEGRREAVHHEPRHLQAPLVQKRGDAAVARGALDVAGSRIPIVADFVDEPEAEPDRIGEIDPRHAPRIGRMAEDAVGRKREGAVGKALAQTAPATEERGIAAAVRRIPGIELLGHDVEDGRRQPGFERAARTDSPGRRCGPPRCAVPAT